MPILFFPSFQRRPPLIPLPSSPLKGEGFSLVELSMVLVILGLLVGGIVAGQSLVRAAQLRSIPTEYQRYVAAQHTFRDKYFSLPGDMLNATSFWGDAAECPDPAIADGTPGTCNGNGDQQLSAISTARYEHFRYWQHLALAGLIEGSYMGVAGSGSANHVIPGRNAPTSKLSRGSFFPEWLGTLSGDVHRYDGYYGVHYRFGGDDGTGWINTRLLRPEEVWNMDTKLDDGRPGYGRVRTFNAATDPHCSTNADLYALGTTAITCRALFLTGV